MCAQLMIGTLFPLDICCFCMHLLKTIRCSCLFVLFVRLFALLCNCLNHQMHFFCLFIYLFSLCIGFNLFPLCLHLDCNDGSFPFHYKYVVSVCTCWKALDAEANTIDDCVHIYIPIQETHDMLFSQYISQNIHRRDS